MSKYFYRGKRFSCEVHDCSIVVLRSVSESGDFVLRYRIMARTQKSNPHRLALGTLWRSALVVQSSSCYASRVIEGVESA
jgi:hypothetical protein